ncbi:hypothetical protein THRCLA_07208, partial [Thraustotheca clavata]
VPLLIVQMARTVASENQQLHNTPFRGHCLYKTGKCQEERALKKNDMPHNFCNYHRWKQNHNQRKLDSKLRERSQRKYIDQIIVAPQIPQTLQTPKQYPYEQHIHRISPSYQMNREAFRAHILKQLVQIVSEEVLAIEARFAPILPRKCKNERALKTNGQAHNLCDEHRAKQNQNQRKMDSKMRQRRHYSPYASPAQIYEEPRSYHYAQPPHYPVHTFNPNLRTYSQDPSDNITVPTPSYLKGEAREAFRSRVLQKLVNIISEEVTAIPPPQYSSPPHYSSAPQYVESIDSSVYPYDAPARLPSLTSRITRHSPPHNAQYH